MPTPRTLTWDYIVTYESDPFVGSSWDMDAVTEAKINEDGDGKFWVKVASWTVNNGTVDFHEADDLEIKFYNDAGEANFAGGMGTVSAHNYPHDILSGCDITEAHDAYYVRKDAPSVVLAALDVTSIQDTAEVEKIDVSGSELVGEWSCDGDFTADAGATIEGNAGTGSLYLSAGGTIVIDGKAVMSGRQTLAAYSSPSVGSFSGVYITNPTAEFASLSDLEALSGDFDTIAAAFDDLRTALESTYLIG